jgi:hypothetical protein
LKRIEAGRKVPELTSELGVSEGICLAGIHHALQTNAGARETRVDSAGKLRQVPHGFQNEPICGVAKHRG